MIDDGGAPGASGHGPPEAPDFAHTEAAERRRRKKALRLARYAWDRRISGAELTGLDDAALRRFARAAGVHPPGSRATWDAAAELIAKKQEWADRHPDRPETARAHPEERIMWIKPPVPGW